MPRSPNSAGSRAASQTGGADPMSDVALKPRKDSLRDRRTLARQTGAGSDFEVSSLYSAFLERQVE